MQTWIITGISSGLGRAMAEKLLSAGNKVIGTVRRREPVADLVRAYPETLRLELLDVRDRQAVRRLVEHGFAEGRVDVLVSNAGYGLFGAAEELSDEEVDAQIGTNLLGSIDLIRYAIGPMRAQGGGRIIQISSYGGQVAYPGNSLYHATKWGIEGFCESVAKEVASFGIVVTIVEPGGARTDFRYRSAVVAKSLPSYDDNPAHAFMRMLDKMNGLAPGDPEKMADRIIESASAAPAPMRLVLGSQAISATIEALEARLADFRDQKAAAASTDVASVEAK